MINTMDENKYPTPTPSPLPSGSRCLCGTPFKWGGGTVTLGGGKNQTHQAETKCPHCGRAWISTYKLGPCGFHKLEMYEQDAKTGKWNERKFDLDKSPSSEASEKLIVEVLESHPVEYLCLLTMPKELRAVSKLALRELQTLSAWKSSIKAALKRMAFGALHDAPRLQLWTLLYYASAEPRIRALASQRFSHSSKMERSPAVIALCKYYKDCSLTEQHVAVGVPKLQKDLEQQVLAVTRVMESLVQQLSQAPALPMSPGMRPPRLPEK